jgi:hypothetical protein
MKFKNRQIIVTRFAAMSRDAEPLYRMGAKASKVLAAVMRKALTESRLRIDSAVI